MTTKDIQPAELIQAALEARLRAVAPFSNFRVGAALTTIDGTVYEGCNIESASYGMTVCAERVAIWKALSEGVHAFGPYLAVVADTAELTPPCGTCRQIIWEFCPQITVVMANLHGAVKMLPICDLLPLAFDAKFLG